MRIIEPTALVEAWTRSGSVEAMALDMATPILIFYIALWVLGTLIFCLLAFVVIRTAILGALKAHSRWVRDGMP